jgi:hypothetical protein
MWFSLSLFKAGHLYFKKIKSRLWAEHAACVGEVMVEIYRQKDLLHTPAVTSESQKECSGIDCRYWSLTDLRITLKLIFKK